MKDYNLISRTARYAKNNSEEFITGITTGLCVLGVLALSVISAKNGVPITSNGVTIGLSSDTQPKRRDKDVAEEAISHVMKHAETACYDSDIRYAAKDIYDITANYRDSDDYTDIEVSAICAISKLCDKTHYSSTKRELTSMMTDIALLQKGEDKDDE